MRHELRRLNRPSKIHIQGKAFYFYSAFYKQMFDRDPEGYVRGEEIKSD